MLFMLLLPSTPDLLSKILALTYSIPMPLNNKGKHSLKGYAFAQRLSPRSKRKASLKG